MSAAGRYAASKRLVLKTDDGAAVAYLAVRLLPAGATVAGHETTAVRPGETHRPDLLAWRTLRDPLLAYRIADANDAMDPLSLCNRADAVLDLPGSEL